MAPLVLIFRIYKDDCFEREECFALPVIKIGKMATAHLKLEDETVSLIHAVIEVNGPSDVYITDLSSARGTTVNGQKVTKSKLQSGDTIMVGALRIDLEFSHSSSKEVVRAALN